MVSANPTQAARAFESLVQGGRWDMVQKGLDRLPLEVMTRLCTDSSVIMSGVIQGAAKEKTQAELVRALLNKIEEVVRAEANLGDETIVAISDLAPSNENAAGLLFLLGLEKTVEASARQILSQGKQFNTAAKTLEWCSGLGQFEFCAPALISGLDMLRPALSLKLTEETRWPARGASRATSKMLRGLVMQGIDVPELGDRVTELSHSVLTLTDRSYLARYTLELDYFVDLLFSLKEKKIEAPLQQANVARSLLIAGRWIESSFRGSGSGWRRRVEEALKMLDPEYYLSSLVDEILPSLRPNQDHGCQQSFSGTIAFLGETLKDGRHFESEKDPTRLSRIVDFLASVIEDRKLDISPFDGRIAGPACNQASAVLAQIGAPSLERLIALVEDTELDVTIHLYDLVPQILNKLSIEEARPWIDRLISARDTSRCAIWSISNLEKQHYAHFLDVMRTRHSETKTPKSLLALLDAYTLVPSKFGESSNCLWARRALSTAIQESRHKDEAIRDKAAELINHVVDQWGENKSKNPSALYRACFRASARFRGETAARDIVKKGDRIRFDSVMLKVPAECILTVESALKKSVGEERHENTHSYTDDPYSREVRLNGIGSSLLPLVEDLEPKTKRTGRSNTARILVEAYPYLNRRWRKRLMRALFKKIDEAGNDESSGAGYVLFQIIANDSELALCRERSIEFALASKKLKAESKPKILLSLCRQSSEQFAALMLRLDEQEGEAFNALKSLEQLDQKDPAVIAANEALMQKVFG